MAAHLHCEDSAPIKSPLNVSYIPNLIFHLIRRLFLDYQHNYDILTRLSIMSSFNNQRRKICSLLHSAKPRPEAKNAKKSGPEAKQQMRTGLSRVMSGYMCTVPFH